MKSKMTINSVNFFIQLKLLFLIFVAVGVNIIYVDWLNVNGHTHSKLATTAKTIGKRSGAAVAFRPPVGAGRPSRASETRNGRQESTGRQRF